MATPEHPTFSLFSPLQEGDFGEWAPEILDIQHAVRDTVHDLYAIVEAEALPAPEGATAESERAALLNALPLERATYADNFDRCRATLTSSFAVPFATDEQWHAKPNDQNMLKPNVTVTTTVNLSSRWPSDADSAKHAAFVLDLSTRLASPDTEAITTTRSRSDLAGVPGTKIRSNLGFVTGYSFDAEQQAEIRGRIGEVLKAGDEMSIEAIAAVSTPPQFGLIDCSKALEFRSHAKLAGSFWGDKLPPTSPEFVIPSLRVFRALLEVAKIGDEITLAQLAGGVLRGILDRS